MSLQELERGLALQSTARDAAAAAIEALQERIAVRDTAMDALHKEAASVQTLEQQIALQKVSCPAGHSFWCTARKGCHHRGAFENPAGTAGPEAASPDLTARCAAPCKASAGCHKRGDFASPAGTED